MKQFFYFGDYVDNTPVCVLWEKKDLVLGYSVTNKGKAGKEDPYNLVNVESPKSNKSMVDSAPREFESISDLVTLKHESGMVDFEANSSIVNFDARREVVGLKRLL